MAFLRVGLRILECRQLCLKAFDGLFERGSLTALRITGEFEIRGLESPFEVRSVPASRLGAAVKVVEECKELIKVFLRDRIVFVIVAHGTLNR